MKHQGQFKKDDPRINRKGRPKKSESTADEMRAWITFLLEKNWPRLEAAMDAMDDKQCAYFMMQHLVKYKLPAPQDDFMRLDDATFERIVKELEKRTQTIY